MTQHRVERPHGPFDNLFQQARWSSQRRNDRHPDYSGERLVEDPSVLGGYRVENPYVDELNRFIAEVFNGLEADGTLAELWATWEGHQRALGGAALGENPETLGQQPPSQPR